MQKNGAQISSFALEKFVSEGLIVYFNSSFDSC